eukprot:4943128-Amphidinium_carterae.4
MCRGINRSMTNVLLGGFGALSKCANLLKGWKVWFHSQVAALDTRRTSQLRYGFWDSCSKWHMWQPATPGFRT